MDELRRVAPASHKNEELLDGLIAVINRYLKPLPDSKDHSSRTATIISRYCSALQKRAPAKRPKTPPGVFKSLSTFITKDIRSAAKEYAAFEARAEKALTGNPAMHLTSRGVAAHKERALNIVDRFMLIVAKHWEQLGAFKTRLQDLENRYYDRDNWALHLHDRLNRLANLLTAVDSSVTSLKRALINSKPHEKAVEALRALKDYSLNPLEFIGKVFLSDDRDCTITVTPPEPPLNYSNHFIVREILLELTHNAISAGAREVSLTAVAEENGAARIEITDDAPGGIPRQILNRIGKERIHASCSWNDEMDIYKVCHPENGWGLFTVINNMIPSLGPKASIVFDTPLGSSGGTRITFKAPIIDKTEIQTHIQPKIEHSFQVLDPFITGGCAVGSNVMHAHVSF